MSIFKRALNYWRKKTWPGHEYARWKGVTVGNDCRIFSLDYSEPYLISFGDHVTVSTNVTFLTHDGSTWLFRDEKGRRFDYQRIEIGSHCFIGAGSIILPGVKIGDRVIVGAGSVVTKSVPSGAVVAGNPARYIRSYNELEVKALREFPTIEDLGGTISQEGIQRNVRESYRSNIQIDGPR